MEKEETGRANGKESMELMMDTDHWETNRRPFHLNGYENFRVIFSSA